MSDISTNKIPYIYIKGHHINLNSISDWYDSANEGKLFIWILIYGREEYIRIEVDQLEKQAFGKLFSDNIEQLIYLV